MATGTPPRRSFGQQAGPSIRPTSVVSSSSLATSPPPNTTSDSTLALAAPQPQRARSTSAASLGGSQVAERATQWLSSLAPRGEGRGREFLANTLVGVASVASSVGQEVNGYINQGSRHSRPNSFSASSPDALPFAPRVRRDSRIEARRTPSPPPQPASGRRALAPANASRLGREAAAATPAAVVATEAPRPVSVVSPTGASFPHRAATAPIERRDSGNSQSTLSARRDSGHARRDSRPSHARTGSLPLTSVSPVPSAGSRRGYTTPYKIGFQPSGVRSDRTAEFIEQRRIHGAEREKEEGRLGRRWAKVSELECSLLTLARRSPFQPDTAAQPHSQFQFQFLPVVNSQRTTTIHALS